jgi:hypothetical protein
MIRRTTSADWSDRSSKNDRGVCRTFRLREIGSRENVLGPIAAISSFQCFFKERHDTDLTLEKLAGFVIQVSKHPITIFYQPAALFIFFSSGRTQWPVSP